MPSPRLPRELLEDAVRLWRAHGRNTLRAAKAAGLNGRTFSHRLHRAQEEGLVQIAAERWGAQTAGNIYRVQQGDIKGIPGPIPEGQTLRGISPLYDAHGELQKIWVKTKQQGRPQEDAFSLPDPKTVESVATMVDAQGRVGMQWIREKPADVAKEALWQAFADSLIAKIEPLPPIPFSGDVEDNLAVLYPVGDHHMGMLSWAPESGANYDISIGKALLAGATEYLVAAAPRCFQACIILLGDFLHIDSTMAITPTSRNILDADGRFAKMVDAAIEAVRRMIETALRRHASVHVIIEIGNHDLSTSIFLSRCIAAVYADNPRVTIDLSPAHYHYWKWGQNLIGTHHGHGAKLQDLPLIMAHDRSEAWGSTKHRYIHTGHVHHDSVKDIGGVLVETHGILPPADAYASGKGYRSMRRMKAIVLHHDHGEVARHTVNPRMLLPSEAA